MASELLVGPLASRRDRYKGVLRPKLLSGPGLWHLNETVATDANQFKASGYLDTGKLGQAVSIYGNAAGTAGSTLTFNRGAQISGNNYEMLNGNQGTISLWFKPAWAGTDGATHYLFANKVDATHYLLIYKTATNNQIVATLYDGTNNPSAVYSATTINSGTFYNVIARWSINTVNGTNMVDVRVNNGTAGVSATAYVGFVPAAQSFIGSDATDANQAQSLIDDVAIYDRVLTAGEMTSINVPNEAGYVADSSLKFYAKMDGSGTLQPVTYNGGCSINKRLYNASTNPNGDLVVNGNFEAATAGAPASWTAVSAPTLADAEAANILQDTRSQKISVTLLSQGIMQTLTVTAASNWSIEGWLMSDGTNIAQIRVRDASNSVDLLTLPVTAAAWTHVNAAFKAPAGCISVEIYVESGTLAAHDVYVDSISVHKKNLADNGGMEGGATPPASWTQETNATATSDASPHSGTNELKIVAGAVNVGAKQSITLVTGASYLITGWARATSGKTASITMDKGNAATQSIGTVTATSYTRISGIFQATGTAGIIYLRGVANGDTVWFDDVSVTPLDNVALSFKSWAPVADASAVGSSLSVQGNATGVQSGAGVRGSAYTFDGSTGYLRQQTIAVSIGTLGYVGNDTTTASFTDDGATMSTYQSSAPYPYMIVVTNSDNTTSWGYMGAASGGNITIFTTKIGTTRGWNGTAPVAGTKVPVGYEVRRTDFQITGALTVGAWVKNTSIGVINSYISKAADSASAGYFLGSLTSSGFDFRINSTVVYSNNNATGQWFHVIGVYDGTTMKIYVNGDMQGSVNYSSGITDTAEASLLGTGKWASNAGSLFYQNGSIDEPTVYAGALTPAEIRYWYTHRYTL